MSTLPNRDLPNQVHTFAKCLPNEIWEKICLNADFASAKQHRLVNTTFNGFASKVVFETVYATALPDSLGKLINIAQHPILSKHVKALFYLTERLDTRILRARVSSEWDRKLRALVELQQELVSSGEEDNALSQYVPLLPRLRVIRCISAKWIMNKFRWGNQPIISSLAIRGMSHEFPFVTNHYDDMAAFSPHAALIRAVAYARIPIKEWSFEQVPWEFWENDRGPSLFSLAEDDAKIAMANLTSLELKCSVGPMGDIAVPGSPVSQLAAFFSAAPHLERVRVEFFSLRWWSLRLWPSEGTETDITDVVVEHTPRSASLRVDMAYRYP